jgi:hypothetical protein
MRYFRDEEILGSRTPGPCVAGTKKYLDGVEYVPATSAIEDD